MVCDRRDGYFVLADFTASSNVSPAKYSPDSGSIATNRSIGKDRHHPFGKARLLGSYFTTDRQRLRELARERGVHHLDNLTAGLV